MEDHLVAKIDPVKPGKAKKDEASTTESTESSTESSIVAGAEPRKTRASFRNTNATTRKTRASFRNTNATLRRSR